MNLKLKILLAIIAVFLLASCRTKYVYVPGESKIDSVTVEKLVPVVNPADSAAIKALLECDENGKVILRDMEILTSKNALANLTIDSLGNLLASMRTLPDTVYLPSKETVITKEQKVPYPVEKELTEWQQIRLSVGGWAMAICLILIGLGIFYIVKR